MKRARAIVLLLLVGGCSFFVAYRFSHAPQTSESQPSPQTSQCDQALWQYVYHPARLQVLDPCISVSGSVEEVRKEADGDIRILFRLDQQFESLLNEKNVSSQFGDLVLEPICQGNCQCERVKETANFRTSFPEVLFRGVDRLLVHAR